LWYPRVETAGRETESSQGLRKGRKGSNCQEKPRTWAATLQGHENNIEGEKGVSKGEENAPPPLSGGGFFFSGCLVQVGQVAREEGGRKSRLTDEECHPRKRRDCTRMNDHTGKRRDVRRRGGPTHRVRDHVRGECNYPEEGGRGTGEGGGSAKTKGKKSSSGGGTEKIVGNVWKKGEFCDSG